MTAEQRDAGAVQLLEPALENSGDDVALDAFLRKPGNRERRQRPAAHRVDVAQRVRSRDLAVDERVVHDRREEVDGLNERRPAIPPVHTRIVRGPEVDEDTVVRRDRNGAQHLSELAGGEFARSTSAGDHVRQSHGSPFEWLFVAGLYCVS